MLAIKNLEELKNPKLASILAELKSAFGMEYGDHLAQIILFGSQARNEATNDSDIDILVVLKGEIRPSDEILRTGGIVSTLSLKHEQVISCIFMTEKRFLHHNSMLLQNIRKEGMAV
ncbi:MAG: nucleotidyltransferase domain-containing protein [Oscillatoriales cyanobacterium SM2_1_8]|nr:nucleotidyltransferase domain-containing protein [Oscillatoriales cyanobacterium SM2_1_8]